MHKIFLFFLATTALTLSSMSQRVIKVKRKGVTPVNVTSHDTKSSAITLQQFAGKWQEVYRTDDIKNRVDFTDTIFFNFLNNNQVYSRNGVNLSLLGNADLHGNELEVAGDMYTIKSLSEMQAILKDADQYSHTFIKKQNFYYETFPTNSMVTEQFTTPVKADLSAIAGKWRVYRRDAKPGATANDEMFIKGLRISLKHNDTTATGEVTFYQEGKSEVLPCTIAQSGEGINIVTEKHTWQVSIYKADATELVFGSMALLYYCRPL
ncbi:MAG: hypothetical protein H0W12_00590 [Chitinophagaceae bacterium]|nr:hypothetical protein [Chitinophagaceae bacterium]